MLPHCTTQEYILETQKPNSMVNIVIGVAHILVLHDGFTLSCEASCDYMKVFSNVHSSMFKL